MAETIGTSPAIVRFEIVAANLAVRVDYTARSFARLTVQFETNAGKLALVGTDGVILAATDYTPIAADAPYTMFLGRDQQTSSIYVQADTANTFVSISAEGAEGED